MEHYIPLKVEFCLYENILCGKILQQDKRLKKNIDDENIIISDCEGYKIKISHNPALNKNILYLRGVYTAADNYVFHYEYISKECAEKALSNFKDLISDLNNYYKGNQEPVNTCTVEICE